MKVDPEVVAPLGLKPGQKYLMLTRPFVRIMSASLLVSGAIFGGIGGFAAARHELGNDEDRARKMVQHAAFLSQFPYEDGERDYVMYVLGRAAETAPFATANELADQHFVNPERDYWGNREPMEERLQKHLAKPKPTFTSLPTIQPPMPPRRREE
ncbi:MAG TPA: hypothetical protein VGN57_18885 [Pirellulaceae bacterium]|nr:hypothetical protein [Pirellulaceae bacterium]